MGKSEKRLEEEDNLMKVAMDINGLVSQAFGRGFKGNFNNRKDKKQKIIDLVESERLGYIGKITNEANDIIAGEFESPWDGSILRVNRRFLGEATQYAQLFELHTQLTEGKKRTPKIIYF